MKLRLLPDLEAAWCGNLELLLSICAPDNFLEGSSDHNSCYVP